MMTNLFTMFDPSSSTLSLNWTLMSLPLMIIPIKMMFSTKVEMIFIKIYNSISKEIYSMMENSKKKNSVTILFSIFMMISLMNISSLLPFNFTVASQISFTLPAALLMWTSFNLFGWCKNTKSMMTHLLPLGTPLALMPVMVMIELISQIIRPITLSVRLTANMVAGHLLMTLLGSFALKTINLTILSSPILMALSFLEICVSIIQGFVFMTLLTLYSTETN